MQTTSDTPSPTLMTVTTANLVTSMALSVIVMLFAALLYDPKSPWFGVVVGLIGLAGFVLAVVTLVRKYARRREIQTLLSTGTQVSAVVTAWRSVKVFHISLGFGDMVSGVSGFDSARATRLTVSAADGTTYESDPYDIFAGDAEKYVETKQQVVVHVSGDAQSSFVDASSLVMSPRQSVLEAPKDSITGKNK